MATLKNGHLTWETSKDARLTAEQISKIQSCAGKADVTSAALQYSRVMTTLEACEASKVSWAEATAQCGFSRGIGDATKRGLDWLANNGCLESGPQTEEEISNFLHSFWNVSRKKGNGRDAKRTAKSPATYLESAVKAGKKQDWKPARLRRVLNELITNVYSEQTSEQASDSKAEAVAC